MSTEASPVRDVVVLCWSTPETSDRRAHTIATFLGADATVVTLTTTVKGEVASIQRSVPRCTCLIVDAETLAKAADRMQGGVSGLRSLTSDVAEHVFIYGFRPTSRHEAVLRMFSSGRVIGVQPLSDPEAEFHVAENCREWCGQFSGLSLGAVDSGREHRFEYSGSGRQATIISAGDDPFFVRAEHGAAQVSFVACDELADLDEVVGHQASLLSWFSRLVPLMMFLRGSLGNRVWHNDSPRACFIIDDPALKERHGFLEYRRLVDSMRRHGFSTCIAFIPWNHRTSNPDVAALFSPAGAGPSLCVHGCDHTSGEFATTDVELLRGKARLALERMRAHRRLTGVPFDNVMVFPQGLFSAEALAALKVSGYLAAVNSDVCPSTAPATLPLRERLDVAITRFVDFPLFGRHYPRDLAEFAFDLFMGKPALAVEHHGYFRNGYTALESFVARLNGLDEQLEWTGLGGICSRACLTRTTAGGDVHVRFYTSRFSLTNTGTGTRRYLLLQRRTQGGPSPSVSVNGRDWRCECDEGHLRIDLSLNAGQTADIRVLSDEADSVGSSWREPDVHDASVRIRRLVCDFRDNHVDTNRVLNAIVATARNVTRTARVRTAPLLNVMRRVAAAPNLTGS